MEEEIDRSNWASTLDPVVITTELIASGKSSVLWVVHDEGHGGWQLYDERDVSNQRPVVLLKSEALRLDPTLLEVTDLPVGWEAHRSEKGAEWKRNKRHPSEIIN
jgi:hypothetical protein